MCSENYDDYQLRKIANELTHEIDKVPDVSITHKIGGRSKQVRVVLDKEKMATSGVDFLGVLEKIKASNQQLSSGSFNRNDTEFLVSTGSFLESAEDVENLIIGTQQQQPVYLYQIAEVIEGPELP